MKKRLVNMLLLAGLGMVCLSGCQKMPEVSENGDIPHAKSSLEEAVEDVAAQETGTTASDGAEDALAEQGGFYDGVIGTEENGIWVYAEVPAVAEHISRLTLTAREDLDEAALKAFLDSQGGTVQDLTQEFLAEREAALNAPPVEVDAGDGIELSTVELAPHFGDDSTLVFSDGERTASFYWNTWADFEDEKLYQKYIEICQAEARELARGEQNEGVLFPMAQAQELLMEKLKPIGITEIDYGKIYYYENDDGACYEIWLKPRYEGIGLAQEFGSTTKEEVIPDAVAMVTQDGVAQLHLWNCLGQIGERKDVGKILSFAQVRDILEKYLESNMLVGCAGAKLTQAEVVYYPVYQEEESELELIPAWHIYVPLDQWLEASWAGDPAYSQLEEKSAAWNIYLDAVTGELLRVE